MLVHRGAEPRAQAGIVFETEYAHVAVADSRPGSQAEARCSQLYNYEMLVHRGAEPRAQAGIVFETEYAHVAVADSTPGSQAEASGS